MKNRYIIVAYNPYGPADSTRFVLTPYGEWVFKYADVNYQMWSKFDSMEEAEQTAEFVRNSLKGQDMTVIVEAIRSP